MRLIDSDALFTDLDGMMAVSPTGYIHGDTVADMIGDQPAVDAIPLEYISRYQKSCGGDLAMALEDLKASWQIVGPTWKPKR